MKSYLKRVESKSTEVVDSDTGEILTGTTNEKHILIQGRENFFMTYFSIVGLYKELTGLQIKMLGWIMAYEMLPARNQIVLTSTVIEEIAVGIGSTFNSVKHSIKPLVAKNILIKKNTSKRDGVYHINPEYFWKGASSERRAALDYVLRIKTASSSRNQVNDLPVEPFIEEPIVVNNNQFAKLFNFD